MAKFPTWRPSFGPSNAFSRWGKTLLISIMVGILCGSAAAGLEGLIQFGSHHLVGKFTQLGSAQILNFNWGILLFPLLGGLTSGLLIILFRVPRFKQSTDVLTRAFHYDNGALGFKNSFIRAISAAITMSFGGSIGPEGPIAGLSAAIGSYVSKALNLTIRERRIFLLAGCAAGVGAIFRCPLGGALFATSIIYKEPEFEHTSMMPAFVASVIGYSTFMSFWGYGEPLLQGTAALTFRHPSELIAYSILGILCGIVGVFFSTSFAHILAFFSQKSRLPFIFSPAVGGLIVGIIACIFPQVMDGQYRFIQNALDPHFFISDGAVPLIWLRWTLLLTAIIIAKCLATAFTVGSGGSGGMLGPSVFIGGTVGIMLGAFLQWTSPHYFPETLREALIPVGMAGVLSASMRIPLASIVMVAEMTGSYGLIVPLMLVSVSAYIIGRRYGLNQEQVASAAQSPAHAGDAIVNYLETTTVGSIFTANWSQIISPTQPLQKIVKSIVPGSRPHFMVVDKGQLLGMIGIQELRDIVASSIDHELPSLVIAADIMHAELHTVRSEDSLDKALSLFQKLQIDVLPVVETQGKIFIGVLERGKIQSALEGYFEAMKRQLFSEHDYIQSLQSSLPLSILHYYGNPKEQLEKITVPSEIVGKSLKSANFRNDYHYEVIAIMSWDGNIICPPDPDRILTGRDLLLTLKKNESAKEANVA